MEGVFNFDQENSGDKTSGIVEQYQKNMAGCSECYFVWLRCLLVFLATKPTALSREKYCYSLAKQMVNPGSHHPADSGALGIIILVGSETLASSLAATLACASACAFFFSPLVVLQSCCVHARVARIPSAFTVSGDVASE